MGKENLFNIKYSNYVYSQKRLNSHVNDLCAG